MHTPQRRLAISSLTPLISPSLLLYRLWMLPRHTIALNSNLIWLTGGVARALRAALNAPTRVMLTARNGLPSASTQLIPERVSCDKLAS